MTTFSEETTEKTLQTVKWNGFIVCGNRCEKRRDCKDQVLICCGMLDKWIPKDTCPVFGKIGSFKSTTTITIEEMEEDE